MAVNSSEPIIGLGGRGDYLAVVPGVNLDKLALTAEERATLAAIGRASTIEQIVSRSAYPEEKTIALLLGLRARGLVVPARKVAPPPGGPMSASSSEQVDLDEDRKSEILALEGLVDSASHYDILGLDPTASTDEIRRAYHDVSRRFHPDRYFQKNLGSFRSRIERLFRRASEAHAVLSNPEKRAAYDRAHPELFDLPGRATPVPLKTTMATPMPDGIEAAARADERRTRLSRHPYFARAKQVRSLTAEASAAATGGDLTRALSLLHRATQLEPENEELQAEINTLRRRHEGARARQELERGEQLQKEGNLEGAAAQYRKAAAADPKNASAAVRAAEAILAAGGDLKEAKALAQRAVELLPRSADNRIVLAKVLLQADMKKLAKRELEEAVRLDTGHQEARALLKKLRWPF